MNDESQLLSYANQIQLRIQGGYYTLNNLGGEWEARNGWASGSGRKLKTGKLMDVYKWLYEKVPIIHEGKVIYTG